jgi:hypothetical protein
MAMKTAARTLLAVVAGMALAFAWFKIAMPAAFAAACLPGIRHGRRPMASTAGAASPSGR